MKYFAKYILQKGEIKEGAMVRHKISGDIGTVTRISDAGKYQDEEIELVKLCLCSRDIQVGDKVCDLDDQSLFVKVTEIRDGIPYTIMYGSKEPLNVQGCIKIIGEISPGALDYVKEGDEFDKDQVKILGLFNVGNSLREIETEVDPQYLEGYRCKIKCPWGHFH